MRDWGLAQQHGPHLDHSIPVELSTLIAFLYKSMIWKIANDPEMGSKPAWKRLLTKKTRFVVGRHEARAALIPANS